VRNGEQTNDPKSACVDSNSQAEGVLMTATCCEVVIAQAARGMRRKWYGGWNRFGRLFAGGKRVYRVYPVVWRAGGMDYKADPK
jgi:hypothetical protein